jgi:outer membrane protein OmpA-like peptidoglycan-associated protein
MTRQLRPASAFRLLWPIPALLLAAAPPAPAAEPSSLDVTWGGDEEGWLTLDRLRVLVDGAEVQLAPPAGGAAPATTVHRGPIATGARTISVEAAMRGESSVFTYVDGYRFIMRGHLDLQVVPGDAVAVQADVVTVPGVTVEPEDRYRLALSARIRHAEGALEVAQATGDARPPAPSPAPSAAASPAPALAPAAAPAVAPAAVAASVGVSAAAGAGQEAAATTPAPAMAPAPAPAPAPASAPATAAAAAPATTGACALPPIRFAFDSADLDQAARDALGRFAACLARRGGRARLSGHWDALGPLDYNVALGERRARAAASFLVGAGLPAARVEVVRLTETADVCQEATPACRARNRRVEAVVLDEDRR